jgi:GntR family transcriptional regulator
MSLNTQSPVPLYRQLADQILADIDAGRYAVASRIPSETDFADRYAIGRPTVRQATDVLVRAGRLERRRGSGTYVLPPSRSIDLFSLAGTSSALQASDLDATLELVSGPDREVAADGTERLTIERRAIADGAPVLYETLRFDADLFNGLDNHRLANVSLSALVRDVFFLEPTSASQTFFAIVADKHLADNLAVSVGSPLLQVHRELHFGEYRSALIAEIICRTDQFEFSQTLYPARTNTAAATEFKNA